MAKIENEKTDVKAEETVAKSASNEGAQNEPEKQPTIEELMANLAKANAEMAKLRNKANDASSEAAKYKKQLREKQTAEEIQSEEALKAQEEHAKYVAELEDFKRKAEAKARYALQGMGEELAAKAAEAEVNGDMDELASIQRKHTEALLKEKETEWLKNRPEISAGNSEGDDANSLEAQIARAMGVL